MSQSEFLVVIERKITRTVRVTASSRVAARVAVDEYGMDLAWVDFPHNESVESNTVRIVKVERA